MLRFSLLTLLGVVLVAAVGSAALANPTDTWRSVFVTLTLVVLFSFTTLAALNRSRRSFALGFVMAGWLYFVLTFNSTFKDIRPTLLTDRIVDWSAGLLHEDIRETKVAMPADPFSSSTNRTWYKLLRYEDVGHCLWTLILATIGGLFASWLGRRGCFRLWPSVATSLRNNLPLCLASVM